MHITHKKYTNGKTAAQVNYDEIKFKADANTIAVDGVLTTLIDDSAAKIFVALSDGKSGDYRIDAGALVVVSDNAIFSNTKDNASTVNVYIESNVLKVQNKTAASISVQLFKIGF